VTVEGQTLVGLLGTGVDDEQLLQALALLGLPRDAAGLTAMIEQAQDAADESGEGGGVAAVPVPTRSIRLTFFHGVNAPWYLAEVSFGSPQPGRPAGTDLPLDLSLGQSRTSVHGRLGEPTLRALFGSDRWERPDLICCVDYDSADRVKRVHCALGPQALDRRATR